MKALCLLSGGIDSAVAAFLSKKNFDLSAVHFSIEPFTDNEPEIKSRKLAEKLGINKLFVINAGEIFAEITRKCDHRYYFVLSKRLMLKIAEKIAIRNKCDFIVTGESLAQVSSQTLSNLVNIDKAIKMKVLRPLLAFDKSEIIKMAQEIGTFDISKGPEVCDQLGPKNPITKSDLSKVLEEESNLDLNNMINVEVK